MAIALNLGFPQIVIKREQKRADESFWADKSTAKGLRRERWKLQRDIGIKHIPSNDFSLYDQVLDTAAIVEQVPGHFGYKDEAIDPANYFAMSRGSDKAPAMEITKWFDSNYHFIVHELETGRKLRFASTKPAKVFPNKFIYKLRF